MTKLGFYTQDTGQNVYYFYMAAEPPEGQYILREGKWHPLVDGYYLMDMIINGQPDLTGPEPALPKGAPPAPAS